ncbi:MAG: Uma2 family endonuclease [Cyanobacteria bacterium]|nr:Uma2 family endonuclease [Cyanobacteriota bacterium]MDW8199918.1 Uma2 family endonuclease [Cyanobacteriota bacterium SKYGB_h_bin112]
MVGYVQGKPIALSLDEFLALPETEPASEYIDGEVIQKEMPKGKHSLLQIELGAQINAVSKPNRIALALPELRCTFDNCLIVPDIAVFTWNRIPFTDSGEIPDDFLLAPDWMIEILSSEQSPIKPINKILHALKHGMRLGWLLAPDDRSVLTFLPDQAPNVVEGDSLLPVLPEIPLELTADAVFDWLVIN